jgi:hyperosmotically inducible protein
LLILALDLPSTSAERFEEAREAAMLRKIAMTLTLAAMTANVALASTPDRKDLQVFNDISAKVNSYTQFTIFDDVNAGVKDGVVTLTGKVTMPYKREAIEKRVADVAGVSRVENKISVLPVSSFDDELRLRIARAIYGNSSFWNYASMANPPIHIIVEHSRVTLTGVVNSEVERALARSLATRFGVMSVTNNLKTDAEVRESLEKAF